MHSELSETISAAGLVSPFPSAPVVSSSSSTTTQTNSAPSVPSRQAALLNSTSNSNSNSCAPFSNYEHPPLLSENITECPAYERIVKKPLLAEEAAPTKKHKSAACKTLWQYPTVVPPWQQPSFASFAQYKKDEPVDQPKKKRNTAAEAVRRNRKKKDPAAGTAKLFQPHPDLKAPPPPLAPAAPACSCVTPAWTHFNAGVRVCSTCRGTVQHLICSIPKCSGKTPIYGPYQEWKVVCEECARMLCSLDY